jgi:hypothetical protein
MQEPRGVVIPDDDILEANAMISSTNKTSVEDVSRLETAAYSVQNGGNFVVMLHNRHYLTLRGVGLFNELGCKL